MKTALDKIEEEEGNLSIIRVILIIHPMFLQYPVYNKI